MDVVSVYLFRNPHTPHAVTASANLTEALLEFDKYRSKNEMSTNTLRNTFAMAFVKFVNGFVDRDIATAGDDDNMVIGDTSDEALEDPEPVETETKVKAKGGGETSMYAFAVRIDMPEDFVDLRHSIVHGEVPSLATLKVYTEKALDWLWQKWWSKNATGDPSQAREEEAEDSEAAVIGRRKSAEAWAQYAESQQQSNDRQSENRGHRQVWDDARLQQMRAEIL